MYLCEVYVTNPSLNVNRPFTYVYDKPLEKYVRVKVLFNRTGNLAIVVSCRQTEQTREEIDRSCGFKVQEILEVIDEEPVISEEIFELASWLSKTTISPFISCLNAMLPKALKTSKSLKGPKMLRRLHKNEGDFTFTKRQKEIYDLIDEGMLAAEARKMSASVITKLIAIGAISEYEEEAQYENSGIEEEKVFETTASGEKVLLDQAVEQAKGKGGFMLDASIGKSINLKHGRRVSINLSITNLLNNQDIVTGGYEQSRSSYTVKDDGTKNNARAYKFEKNPMKFIVSFQPSLSIFTVSTITEIF